MIKKWLFTLLAGLVFLSPQAVASAFRQAEEMPALSPPWKIAVEKIEQAKERGELTVDEAALLRLQALSDVSALPPAFQPPPQAEPPAAVERDGLAEWADTLDVLFQDKADMIREDDVSVSRTKVSNAFFLGNTHFLIFAT